MSVIYDAKKKEWIVPWKAASGRLLREAFATRKEAVAFEQAQALIARREREILKKKKKLQTPDSKITIREIIRRYLVQALIKDSTRASSTYHSAPVIAAFGNRRAALLNKQDILNFAEAQRLRGVRQTTVSRRISVLRSTLTWAEDNNLIPHNPLRGMTFPKGKSRRSLPAHARRSQNPAGERPAAYSARDHHRLVSGTTDRAVRTAQNDLVRFFSTGRVLPHAQCGKRQPGGKPGRAHPERAVALV